MWEINQHVPLSKLGKTWASFSSSFQKLLLMANIRGDDVEQMAENVIEFSADFSKKRSNGRNRFFPDVKVMDDRIQLVDMIGEQDRIIFEIVKTKPNERK